MEEVTQNTFRPPADAPKTNQELREAAQAALDNWDFTPEPDPDGDLQAGTEYQDRIKAGLEYYAADGDAVPEEEVPLLFRGYHPQLDKWEILQELALGVS